jgi:hypothetical protein
MIIFGSYAFTFKRFRAGTHGIPAGAEVLIKCRVFQLFFIPFFPVGKVWILRQGKEDFELPDAIRKSIELTESTRSPFYAYAWLLLIPFIFAGFKYSEYREREYWKAYEISSKERYIDRIGQKIDTARQGDFFSVEILAEPSHCSGGRSFLMVEYAIRDSLLIMYPLNTKPSYSPAKYLTEQNGPVSYTWVAREDLRASAITEPDNYACFKGIAIPGVFEGLNTKMGSYDTRKPKLTWDQITHASQPYSRFHPD